MTIVIRPMRADDYDAVFALWRETEGLVLRDVDGREPVTSYLAHNRDLSFVALDRTRVVGAVLCGTDGRRGYLQHLVVAPSHRRRGTGRELVRQALAALAARGIHKCHLMVLAGNGDGRAFWRSTGWREREDVVLMSHSSDPEANL
jgi:ribosomal protein S18 acetylase RimI-like enzyme